VIKELAWKEYREQRAIWIAMALLAAFVIFYVPALGSFTDLTSRAFNAVMTVILVAAYGLICGSIMFAGEEEFQTLTFLDRLAGWRTPLWGAKFLTGCGLTTGLALLLAVLTISADLDPWGRLDFWERPTGAWWLLWTIVLVVFALDALAVGLLFSTISRNALAAAGLSVIVYLFTWLLTGYAVNLFLRGVLDLEVSTLRVSIQYHLGFALCLHALIALCALWVSWWFFCRDDVRRGLAGVVSPSFPVSFPAFHLPREQPFPGSPFDPGPWRSISWLILRQAWPAAIVLSAAGFIALLSFSVPSADLWLLAWPAFTLIVGVVCGLGSFLGEQARGAERFLGDQRLPVGRIWTIKTGAWLLLALTACAIVFMSIDPPGTWIEKLHSTPRAQGSRAIWAGAEPTSGLFVVLWLVYGFSIGQFCARVARKPIIAAFMSLLLCPVAVIWWPSLVRGGLSAWQVFAAPLVLLAATRLALWEWVAGGSRSGWSPMLIGCAVLSALCLAGGLEYRAWQVPDVGEPFDVREYLARLPTPEQNSAGNRTRAALENLQVGWSEAQHLVPIKNAADVPPRQGAKVLDEVLAKGWRAGIDGLDLQLKCVFSHDWAKRERDFPHPDVFDYDRAKPERDLPDLPLGMLADPRFALDSSVARRVADVSLGVRLLCARALQLQASGDSGEALEHLAIALAILRNAQNHAVDSEELAALSSQKDVFDTFVKCLLVPSLDRESLRRGLKILSRHGSELPSFTDHLEAEYVVITNKLNLAHLWLAQELPAGGLEPPWEHERQARLLNVTFAGLLRAATCSYPEWLAQHQPPSKHDSWAASTLATAGWQKAPQGPGSWLSLDRLGRLIDASPLGHLVVRPGFGCRLPYDLVLCRLRALELQIALALFQLEKGRPARTLDELVPTYLTELPLDPFTDKPFGYRVSTGEQLYPRRTGGLVLGEVRNVLAGQGVVWSAGPDGRDDGGTSGGTDFPWYEPLAAKGADLIFLVPLPPVKGKVDIRSLVW
jgi:hypothetical protein